MLSLQVCNPTPALQRSKSKSTKTQFCVWFFGSNNYAWIEEHNIKDYEGYKDRLSKTCKTAAFKEAYASAEDYITRKAAGVDVDAEIFPEPSDLDTFTSQELGGDGPMGLPDIKKEEVDEEEEGSGVTSLLTVKAEVCVQKNSLKNLLSL